MSNYTIAVISVTEILRLPSLSLGYTNQSTKQLNNTQTKITDKPDIILDDRPKRKSTDC